MRSPAAYEQHDSRRWVVETNRSNNNNQHQQPQPQVSRKPGQVHADVLDHAGPGFRWFVVPEVTLLASLDIKLGARA
jgi:hypothetical protein